MEPPTEIDLDPVQQRVLGSLLEKERTVPDTYPMTLNGLRTACNQSSGRDPILHLSEAEVTEALVELRAMGLTRVIHPSHGARQPKYRQVLDEVLGLAEEQRAVLTLLLLRGPQTPGELRSRAERLHPFPSLEAVESTLGALAGRHAPLARELPRQPGQKEARWVHLLGQPPAEPIGARPAATVAGAGSEEVRSVRAENEELRAALASAEAELARLRQELDDLTAP
jgi:uncharacterized protein YceH (UPF0502 family)